ALAVSLRCEALLTDREEPYARAVQLHERSTRPFERARTELLYGEWLRRARRRSDARVPLRSAAESFERLHAAPWLDRARAELRATGESGQSVPTAPDLLDRLTPQELQVVRLAAAGTSSREIAAQLFLSPRTVEYHPYKAYPKLGVSSRKALAQLVLEPAPLGEGAGREAHGQRPRPFRGRGLVVHRCLPVVARVPAVLLGVGLHAVPTGPRTLHLGDVLPRDVGVVSPEMKLHRRPYRVDL